MERYEVKVTLPIKADSIDFELVFTFVKGALDLGSDSFKVRGPFFLKKPNSIPLIDGPSHVILADTPSLLNTIPNIRENSPSLVIIVGSAVLVKEHLGLGILGIVVHPPGLASVLGFVLEFTSPDVYPTFILW